jgi:hypothetical protein
VLRQDFTDDHEKVARAIEASIRTSAPPEPDMSGRPSITRHLDRAAAKKAAVPDRAIEVLARSLEPIPGGKSLIFFGWGLGSTVGGITGPTASETQAYNDMVNALGRARANLFTLDVADADFHTLEDYLKQVSQLTGGRYEKTHIFPSLAMELVRERSRAVHPGDRQASRNARGSHDRRSSLSGARDTSTPGSTTGTRSAGNQGR